MTLTYMFIIGILVGGGVLGLLWFLRNKAIKVSWYEWLIGAIGFLFLLFTIVNCIGMLYEHESKAVYMIWLWTGLPSIFLLGIAYAMVWRRHRAKA